MAISEKTGKLHSLPAEYPHSAGDANGGGNHPAGGADGAGNHPATHANGAANHPAAHANGGRSLTDSGDRYKWIALSNTTLAILLATLDVSITLIAMPSIFRGIHLDPLVPANSFYLLWMILGYIVVGSVLIVSLGRLGDIFGRVRIYNLGFVIYTAASLLLTIDWLTGRAGATYLIVFRIVQGIGGACLMANAAAIITDAFPQNQRGMALGINNIVGVSGMFVGLVLGGLLAPISWRMVFLISVPVGLFGTVWAYLKLEERGEPKRRPIDWSGQRHLRARPDLPDGRRHLRDPPVRDERDRAGRARGCWACSPRAWSRSPPSP